MPLQSGVIFVLRQSYHNKSIQHFVMFDSFSYDLICIQEQFFIFKASSKEKRDSGIYVHICLCDYLSTSLTSFIIREKRNKIIRINKM